MLEQVQEKRRILTETQHAVQAYHNIESQNEERQREINRLYKQMKTTIEPPSTKVEGFRVISQNFKAVSGKQEEASLCRRHDISKSNLQSPTIERVRA